MRVVLLGAAGIIGREIARALVVEGAKDLVLADVRQDVVAPLASELGLEWKAADVADVSGIARLLREFDLAANATPYSMNVQVMDACLQTGCDYLDLGGLYHVTRRQLDRSKAFEEAGRLAILGCGKAPGITNVLVAHGRRAFDTVRSVRLRSGRRSFDVGEGVHLPYSAQTLLDELTLKPVVLEDGRIREVEPLSRRETVRHPEPFGDIEYLATLHSELATIPKFLGNGLRAMDFMVALPPATMRTLERLVALGLASKTPIVVDGVNVAPGDMTAAALSRRPSEASRELWITEVSMFGERDDRTLDLVLRVTGTERENGTALAAAVTVGLLARKEIRGTGVHAPETIIPPHPFLEDLRRRGLVATETRIESQELGT